MTGGRLGQGWQRSRPRSARALPTPTTPWSHSSFCRSDSQVALLLHRPSLSSRVRRLVLYTCTGVRAGNRDRGEATHSSDAFTCPRTKIHTRAYLTHISQTAIFFPPFTLCKIQMHRCCSDKYVFLHRTAHIPTHRSTRLEASL